MLASILLTKKEQKKLEITHFLETMPAGEYSIKSINDGLGFVYSSTQALLIEMLEDYRVLQDRKESFFSPQGQICWEPGLITYEQYFSFLIRRSVPYQALLFMLQFPEKELVSFCEIQYISIASAMRYLQPLAEYIHQFGLTFNRSKLTLKGDERLIRLTFFNFVWAVSKGEEELFHHFQVGELASTLGALRQEVPLGQDYVGTKEIYLFAEINYIRIQQGFYVKDDPRYDGLLVMNNPMTPEDLCSLFPLPAEHLQAEYHFIQFMFHYAPTYTKADDPRFSMMREHLQQKNQLNKLLGCFEQFWSKKILRGDTDLLKKNPSIHGNLYNVLLCYYVFPQRIPNLFDLLVYFRKNPSVLFTSLQERVEEFFKRFSQRQGCEWLQECQRCLVELFTWLTLEYFEESGQKQPLYVSLIIENNQLFQQDIKAHLRDLSFVELLPFSIYETDRYDYLICSSVSLLPENNQTPFFVFNFFSNNTNYITLYRDLRQQHRKKNLTYKNI